MQNLSAKWMLIATLTSFLIIGCAGTRKVEQEARVSTPAAGAPAADAKVPDGARKEYDRAIVAMKSGNIPEAKNILSNLTQTHPELSGPYVNLGIIHFRADEIDQAEEAFKQALKVNPASAVSLNHLGIIYRGKGKFSEARSNYEKALEIDPQYAYAHLNYGILLDLYFGEYKDALEHYQKFQELAPDQDKQDVEKWIADLELRIKRAKN